jgi:dihydroorotate dehydrogenase (fumarate)
MKLSTTYLGLNLAHPFVVGASPLSVDIDMVRRLEDGGAAAIVLHSLFEEQITIARSGRIHHMDRLDQEFAASLAAFPLADQFAFAPDDYLDHIRRAKAAVGIPIIASLNGMTTESWLSFASQIQQAGADALELNIYQLTTDFVQSSISVETDIRNVVVALKRSVKIPIAVKVSPFFTAFGHFAHSLDSAGSDGLILFNRFYQPDIDIRTLTLVPQLELSTSAELLLRLRWLAVLRGRVRCSLAVTGGVVTPVDGIKAILAGADAVQMVSAILQHGPRYFAAMCDGLSRWMEAKEFRTLDDLRGRVSVASSGDANVFERGNYLRTLQSWYSGSRIAQDKDVQS